MNKDNFNIFKDSLNKESSNIGHPEDSPSFALNANIEGFEGNSYRFQTEQGNEQCFSLPEGYVPIGKIYITDNTLAIFSTDNINSEIGIVKDCLYEKLINNPCLNFNTKFPITGTSKIRKGCDRTIYWRDSFNPDRYLNIDEYLRCKEFSCDLINFNPTVEHPCIELLSVNNQGGSLELGTYSFGVEILDKNENLILRSDLTRKVPIYDEFTNLDFYSIDGGLNIETYSAEIGGVPKTNKSISLKISNLDTKYSFVRIFVRRAVTGDGIITTSHYVGNLLPITEEEMEFTYTGFNPANGDYEVDNPTTTASKVIYDRSKTMEQVQNRLLRGNLSEPYIDISSYQKAASKIWTEWVLEPIDQGKAKYLNIKGSLSGSNVGSPSPCLATVSYKIRYKVNGQEKVYSDVLTNGGRPFIEINETIDYFDIDDVITDVDLDYNPSPEGSCNVSFVFLEWEIIEVDRDIVEKSGKDPDTYWFDSSFMDDEIYAFGIGFEHSNGYTSPILHIPGTPKDVWIKQDNFGNTSCLPLSKPKELIKCLVIEGTVEKDINCSLQVTYDISYKLNGADKYASDVLVIPEGNSQENVNIIVYCANPTDDITDVVLSTSCEAFNELYEECENEPNCSNLIWNIKSQSIETGQPDSLIIEKWTPDLIPFTDLSENDYNKLPTKEKIEYWKVYNTARGVTSGRMGYYECSQSVYLTPDSCCVEDYWGKDFCGNKLEGTPIRHHRMPSKQLILDYQDRGFKLGVRFHNISYPNTDIVSHFFVVGKRTEENKTVLDQGLAGNLGRDKIRTAFSFFQPNLGKTKAGVGLSDCTSTLQLDEERLWYWTPRMLFNKEYINGSYITFLKRVIPKTSRVNSIEVDSIDPRASSSTDVFLGVRVNCFGTQVPKFSTEQLYYPIYANYVVDPYSEVKDDSQTLTNMSHTNKVGFIRTNNVFRLQNNSLALISIKVNRDVYCNLETIEYVRMHNCNFKLQDAEDVFEIYGGDVFVSRFSTANSFLWKVNQNYLKAIAAIGVLLAIGTLSITGGLGAILAPLGITITKALAITITALTQFGSWAILGKAIKTHYDNFYRGKFGNFLCDKNMNTALDKIDEDLEDYVAIANEFINNFWITSEVNIELRHSGLGTCGTYPNFSEQEDFCEASKSLIYNYLHEKMLYYDEGDDQIKVLEIFCPEFYGYNKDYSLIYGEKTYFGVPRTYDFCRACTNEFKNLIIYSEKAFDSEQKDNYLVYKINNAVDVPAHRGEIFNIKYKSNTLYIHCRESTFVLQPNPQTMKTDKDLIILGTGDFLALPPQELIQTDIGYGGSQSTTAYINTEHGSIWLDQSKGEIYSIASGLEEISNVKMEPWFKENLPSEFGKYFYRLTGEEYPYLDSIADTIGLGLMCVYDPKHERIIIHKKDFLPLLPITVDTSYPYQDKIIFNGTLFFVNLKFQQQKPVYFTDKEYFQNKSWTISYSLKHKKWISYHSYMPIFMYNDRNYYYTSDNNNLWRHLHNGKYLTFYDIKFPFIIEGIHTNIQTSDLHAFHYISTSEVFNNDTQTFLLKPETTFNNAYFYNTDETTGLLELVYQNQQTAPYGNILLQEGQKSVIYTNENYKISGLRDVATLSPVVSKNWSDISGYFNMGNSNHGYMDSVPINYSYQNSPYNLKELNDKLIIYRLIFNPTEEDVRLSFILNNNFTFISQR